MKKKIGRPVTSKKKGKKTVISVCPSDLVNSAMNKAYSEGTTVSEIIRRLMRGWVEGAIEISVRGAA